MAGSRVRSGHTRIFWSGSRPCSSPPTPTASPRWPKEELYGLTRGGEQQLVPANIAEGWTGNRAGSVQFLRIAQGSLKELETHVLLAVRVEIAPEAEIEPLLAQTESVGKLLRLLIWKLVPDQP